MSENKPIDLEGMDTLIAEVTHNGGQCSQEFDNWSERHRNNWAAIKSEVESLRQRVGELETDLEGAVRSRPIPEAAQIKLAEAKAYFYHDRKLGTVVKVKDQIKVWDCIIVAESVLGDPAPTPTEGANA